MSDVAERAHARVIVADYASVDAAGKLTIVGGGLSIVGGSDGAGAPTPPFAVAAIIDFDPRDIGESPAVELVLEEPSGAAVQLPGVAGPFGQPQTVAIAQTREIERPAFPNLAVPRGVVRPQIQMVIFLASGLPLAANQPYVWRVKIDHDSRPDWTAGFFVAAPPRGIVFGGGSGPANIPFSPPGS